MEKFFELDLPILGNARVGFFNISAVILESLYDKTDELERQKRIKHLGLISYAYEGVAHTRYEYLMFQCIISELTENSFKGTKTAQGSLTLNNNSYPGNAIIKSWFLLSNFGHTYNRIGDEKTLLLYCYERRWFRKKILKIIQDKQLKEWTENVINNLDYVEFHHVLSVLRLYQQLKGKKKLREEILDIYKVLLLKNPHLHMSVDKVKAMQLKAIFNSLRSVSIVALDSRYSHLPINIDVLNIVLSLDYYQNRYKLSSIDEILKPLLLILSKELYSSQKTLTIQRDYEVRALESLKQTFGKEDKFELLLQKSFDEGIINPSLSQIIHFARTSMPLRVKLQESYLDEFRSIQTVKRNCASQVEASMDINNYSNTKTYDFYTHKDLFNIKTLPTFVENICNLLEAQTKLSLEDYNTTLRESLNHLKDVFDTEKFNNELIIKVITSLFPIFNDNQKSIKKIRSDSFRDILWGVIRFFIDEKYSFDIDYHSNVLYDYFNICDKKGNVNSTLDNIDLAITIEDDNDRKHELRQLRKATKRKYDGYILTCLARIRIFDYSKNPTEREITDIDSVILKVNSKQLILEFNEAKNNSKKIRRVTNAKKDLRDKFIKVLNNNAKGYRIIADTNFGAKLRIKISV